MNAPVERPNTGDEVMRRHLLLTCSGALALAGCVSGPRMSAHTPFSLNETSQRFGERVSERFAVGSSEAALIKELKREHFRISPITWLAKDNPENLMFRADYTGSYYIACNIDWLIDWRSAGGRISVIHGGYGDTCL